MQMRSEPDNQNSVIPLFFQNGFSQSLSIPAAGQKDRGLWGRECSSTKPRGRKFAHAHIAILASSYSDDVIAIKVAQNSFQYFPRRRF